MTMAAAIVCNLSGKKSSHSTTIEGDKRAMPTYGARHAGRTPICRSSFDQEPREQEAAPRDRLLKSGEPAEGSTFETLDDLDLARAYLRMDRVVYDARLVLLAGTIVLPRRCSPDLRRNWNP